MRDSFKYEIANDVGHGQSISVTSMGEEDLPEGTILSMMQVPDESRFLSSEAIKSFSAMFRWAAQGRDTSVSRLAGARDQSEVTGPK